MTLDAFSAVAMGVGVGMFLVGMLALYHRHKGFRFSPRQERAALLRIGWAMALLGFSYAFGGVLGTLLNLTDLETSIPVIAVVPLITRIIGGAIIWDLIRWTLFVFYPAQTKNQKGN